MVRDQGWCSGESAHLPAIVKISILPPQKALEFPEGSLKPKKLKKCTKLNCNFQKVRQYSLVRAN